MGACYSKQPALGSSSKGKAPKAKRPSKDVGRNNREGLLAGENGGNGNKYNALQDDIDEDVREEHRKLVQSDGITVIDSNGSLKRRGSEDVLVVSSSMYLSVEAPSGRAGEDLKDGRGSCRVAPSDSGIESIGTAPEDPLLVETTCGAPLTSSDRDDRGERSLDLSKRLQRLSRGSCYKCGNFKLDDSALTALLTNTYCLCGPRQAGRSNINPNCQTHSPRSAATKESESNSLFNYSNCNFSTPPSRTIESIACDGMTVGDDVDENLAVTSNGIVGNQSFNSRSYDLPVNASSNQSNASSSRKTVGNDSDSGDGLAPRACFDFEDHDLSNLSDFPSPAFSSKRRSLLSEILDFTDSVCKCDFYSNEYCCVVESPRHRVPPTESRLRGSSGLLPTKNGLMDISMESEASDITIVRTSDTEEDHSGELVDLSPTSSSKPTMLVTPKKAMSLTKNVSFAHQNVDGNGLEQSSCHSLNKLGCSISSPGSNSKAGESRALSPEASTSSGVFTHSGSVSETHLLALKDYKKRTLSLGSQLALLSCSSSEALDERTEDDLASLDLDSLSRVTSLSYGSIRQLVESTEDLVQPLEDARRVVIDGEDFVTVPADTYFQLQSDLASLRQQLLFLSSLMQEDTDQQALSASFGL